MQLRSANTEEWWSKTCLDEKTAYRAFMVIATDLLDGETLRITFSGYSFSYAVITKHPKTMAGKLVIMPDSSEDEWWASISPQARAWTRKLAELMPRLLMQPDKALQVTNTHHKLTIQLVGKHNTQAGIPLRN